VSSAASRQAAGLRLAEGSVSTIKPVKSVCAVREWSVATTGLSSERVDESQFPQSKFL
jgi:hypothetical protein